MFSCKGRWIAIRKASFPDEIAHFREMLLRLKLTPPEYEELERLLLEKMR